MTPCLSTIPRARSWACWPKIGDVYKRQAYNGGSVILTLTGTVDYHATKVWQDAADSSNRPGVEL